MAQERVEVEVTADTSPAQRNLDNLNKRVGALTEVFRGLRQAITGAVIAAAYRNALNYADAISDIADATGLSIDTINRFGQAVQASGGTVQGAQNALTKFVQTIGEAAASGGAARSAFLKVGVTLDDLATLSEEDILKKTLQGLAKIPDLAEQARLKTDLLTRQFRAVSLENVLANMGTGIGGGANTAAIISAGRANDKLQEIMNKLAEAIINVTKPLNDFISRIDITTQQIEKFLNSMFLLVASFAGFAVLNRIAIPAIATLSLGFGNLITGGGALATLFRSIAKEAAVVGKGFMAIGRAIAVLPLVFVGAHTAMMPFSDKLQFISKFLGQLIGSIVVLGGSILRLGLKFAGLVGVIASVIIVVNDLLKAFFGIDILQPVVDGLVKAFYALTGVIISIVEIVGDFTKAIMDATQAVVNFTTGLINSIPVLVDVANIIGSVAKITEASFKKVGDDIYNFTKPALDWLGIEFGKLEQKGRDFYDNIMPKTRDVDITPFGGDFEWDLSKFDKLNPAKEAARLREVMDEFEKERKTIALVSREFDDFNKNLIDNINAQAAAVKHGADFAEQQDAINQVLQRSASDVKALQDRLNSLTEREREGGLAAVLQQQIDLINSKTDAYVTAAFTAVKALQAERQALQDIQDQATITQSRMEDYFDSISIKIDVDAMRDQLDLIGLTGDAYDRMAAKLQMEADLKQNLNDIERDRQQLMQNYSNLAYDVFQAEMDILNQREQRARDTADALYNIELDRINKERALRNNAQAGIDDYFQQLADSMKPYEMAQKKLGSIWGNMETTIDNFVKTGKLKFKDFALSVIQDLIAIELKALALQALKTIIGFFGIPGLAKGGPAMQGKPYIVGEKGPELFVPRTSGQVIPNDELGGVGMNRPSSQPVTNNYYTINAVDAKSVAQLFYENRKTMLGTVKMAERELSYRL